MCACVPFVYSSEALPHWPAKRSKPACILQASDMQPGTMPRRTQTRTLRHYTDAYISIHDYTEQSTQLTDPPRNAPTGLGAGGTDPKLGVVSWRTTRVVESRRFGNRCGAALARENEREASLGAMVGGAPRTGRELLGRHTQSASTVSRMLRSCNSARTAHARLLKVLTVIRDLSETHPRALETLTATYVLKISTLELAVRPPSSPSSRIQPPRRYREHLQCLLLKNLMAPSTSLPRSSVRRVLIPSISPPPVCDLCEPSTSSGTAKASTSPLPILR